MLIFVPISSKLSQHTRIGQTLSKFMYGSGAIYFPGRVKELVSPVCPYLCTSILHTKVLRAFPSVAGRLACEVWACILVVADTSCAFALLPACACFFWPVTSNWCFSFSLSNSRWLIEVALPVPLMSTCLFCKFQILELPLLGLS